MEATTVNAQAKALFVSRAKSTRVRSLVFEVGVHVATGVAIVVFYRARIGELVLGVLAGKPDAWRYASKLAIATLPAVAVGLLARGRVEAAPRVGSHVVLCP